MVLLRTDHARLRLLRLLRLPGTGVTWRDCREYGFLGRAPGDLHILGLEWGPPPEAAFKSTHVHTRTHTPSLLIRMCREHV